MKCCALFDMPCCDLLVQTRDAIGQSRDESFHSFIRIKTVTSPSIRGPLIITTCQHRTAQHPQHFNASNNSIELDDGIIANKTEN